MRKLERPGAWKSQRDSERTRPRIPLSLSPEAIEKLNAMSVETKMPRSRIVEALIVSPTASKIIETALKKAASEKKNEG